MAPELFDRTPDGQDVHSLHLSSGALSARILTLGAIIQDLRLEGVPYPLVLGADTLAPYLGPMQYFGAMVGRYANRIANGRFHIDGRAYQVSRNFRGRHCLHGGIHGSGQRIWNIEAHTPSSATLSLLLPDGEMGFPGTLSVVLRITVDGTALDLDISASCDSSTFCNFTHHGYFILDDSGSVADHSLRVDAQSYLPVDNDLIPTGQIASVAGTGFDFRTARSLRAVELDHNFCLSDARRARCPVAWLQSHNLSMQIETTEPGLQVYTATHLPEIGVEGLVGRHYPRHAGIALEAQVWPDAPNQPHFPSALLRPGEIYHQNTRYVFARQRART